AKLALRVGQHEIRNAVAGSEKSFAVRHLVRSDDKLLRRPLGFLAHGEIRPGCWLPAAPPASPSPANTRTAAFAFRGQRQSPRPGSGSARCASHPPCPREKTGLTWPYPIVPQNRARLLSCADS